MAPEVPGPRTPKARPNPGSMRIAIGLTGVVAATALATAIVRAPVPDAASTALDTGAVPTLAPPVVVRHVTRYVQLKAGQTAPPGATVVARPDPSPRVVVVTITAPPAVRRVVVVTRQSGQK